MFLYKTTLLFDCQLLKKSLHLLDFLGEKCTEGEVFFDKTTLLSEYDILKSLYQTFFFCYFASWFIINDSHISLPYIFLLLGYNDLKTNLREFFTGFRQENKVSMFKDFLLV